MKLFLKHHKSYIIIYFISLILTAIYSNLKGFIGVGEIIYIFIFNTFILFCFLLYRYYKNKQLYDLFTSGISSIDDSLDAANESELSKDVSKLLIRQYDLYISNMEKCDKKYKDHLTFINQWVHQMKTPIAVMKLQLKEFEGEERAAEMQEEMDKLIRGLDKSLYYARLDSFQKDFIIKKVNLKEIIRESVNENKRLFIKNRITPRLDIDNDITILSDYKWLKFVVQQIIENGIKYSRNKGTMLFIESVKDKDKVKLNIKDEGIGIAKKDLRRVFDQFFTGENGRKYGESTGMGLYLCREVLTKLGHVITVESEIDKGTTVTIEFIAHD